MTPEIDLPVYPDECDAFGLLNQASFLSLFERARSNRLRNEAWLRWPKASHSSG